VRINKAFDRFEIGIEASNVKEGDKSGRTIRGAGGHGEKSLVDFSEVED
jgi:hypothetical protein